MDTLVRLAHALGVPPFLLLLGRADFQLLVGLEDLRLLRLIADTTNLIAEGEVEQLARAGDPQTTEAQYMQGIRKKTAVLFAAAAEGAAILAGANGSRQAAMRDYGMNLGLAFQLIDDVSAINLVLFRTASPRPKPVMLLSNLTSFTNTGVLD